MCIRDRAASVIKLSGLTDHNWSRPCFLYTSFKEEVTPRNFGRLAAQTAKSVVLQKLRDEERNIIFDKYNKLKDDLVEGEVSREDERYIYVLSLIHI